ncbi:MAG TPA: hypothetical protein VGN95_21830, partial [Pyrinomonadaceae bacterium]|nr:hypothetical protein [Pyrinomonadaceae bacterium]
MSEEIKKRWPRRRLILACAIGCIVCIAIAFAFAQRPRRVSTPEGNRNPSSETGNSTQGPKVITIPKGGDLQKALNAAEPGSTIILEAGATYTGSYVLPVKPIISGTDSDYITIRTSTPDTLLPNSTTRLNPSLHASLLAR